jgi:superfamily I DNA/RNA helicase/mRNA-degrading endonuclease RelE of RelBE toxin-antitoxin system
VVDFRIADTFTSSLARLTGDEQKAAKTKAFDLQLDPSSPGMQFHKLERAKDRSFWSVRVGSDVRLIVHRTEGSLLLCYVAHHDDAYRWAERRRIERHPTTGAAQLVEVRETVREIEIPRYVEPKEPKAAPVAAATPRALFDGVSDEELLGYGVPNDWLGDVRAADDDSIFQLVERLPGEAAEALLELATGGIPAPPVRTAPSTDAFAHPDAQRRFRAVANVEELERALEFPWDKWTVFLHPAQRDTVDRRYNGPARVAGSAGTGKTIAALHRAVHLARRDAAARVLLTTFSETLARALRVKLQRLAGNEPDVIGRIAVLPIDRVGMDVYEAAFGPAAIASDAIARSLLAEAAQVGEPHRFRERFLETEWRDVVDAWQLETWEAYRDVARLGRKTRLGEKQREVLWAIFERVREGLAERGLVTLPQVFARAAELVARAGERLYDHAVADEAQDLGVPQLRFLAALAGERPEGLFFAGDLGQRIFQTPFSWRALGVDVRGRSHTLRINYRTSHQIRRQADRLLPPELHDVDGNAEDRRGTISAFDGPEPAIRVVQSEAEEAVAVAEWLRARVEAGIPPHEIAVFVRSEAELGRARAAVARAALEAADLDCSGEVPTGAVAVGTMHLAKGLEFRAVAVVACDDEVLPLQARIEAVGDDADLEEIYQTERHLLYVACTRAREELLVTGVAPASEFLEDLKETK